MYSDFSLCKRLETLKSKERLSAFEKKKQMEDDQEKSKLQCLEIPSVNPLSSADWNALANVIHEC